MKEFDYIIVGGGCAGLSLAYELEINDKLKEKTLAIIEAREEYKRDKTWSFWKVFDHNFEDCVIKSWNNFTINTAENSNELTNKKFPYQSIDSGKFYKKINSKLSTNSNISFFRNQNEVNSENSIIFNSIFVTCTASLISIILGTLAAYALSRFTFKAGFVRNNDITFFFISQRIMPPIVLSIPFFIFLSTIGLLDSLFGLVVVYIVLLMPIAVWIMVDFFNRVPKELDETALIDGCNPYQAFYKVVLPNSIPGLIVAGMFCIIFGWIDFFFAFILTFTEVQLLPVKVVALNSSITPWWSLSASALISVAPLIIVAFVVERYLSKGNLSGALK